MPHSSFDEEHLKILSKSLDAHDTTIEDFLESCNAAQFYKHFDKAQFDALLREDYLKHRDKKYKAPRINQPRPTDITFGRGPYAANHSGNWFMRQTVALNTSFYSTQVAREHKQYVAGFLLQRFVTALHTRFLAPVGNAWIPVPLERVVEKFQQALRERCIAKTGACSAITKRLVAAGKMYATPKKPVVRSVSQRKCTVPRKVQEDDDDEEEYKPKQSKKSSKKVVKKKSKTKVKKIIIQTPPKPRVSGGSKARPLRVASIQGTIMDITDNAPNDYPTPTTTMVKQTPTATTLQREVATVTPPTPRQTSATVSLDSVVVEETASPAVATLQRSTFQLQVIPPLPVSYCLRASPATIQAFADSYQDCVQQAQALVRTYATVEMEIYPTDYGAQRLANFLRPSVLQHANKGVQLPLPLFAADGSS